MTEVVVDTDVVSFLFKSHPIGFRYDPELADRAALISFMTVAEVERWAIQYRWIEDHLAQPVGTPSQRGDHAGSPLHQPINRSSN